MARKHFGSSLLISIVVLLASVTSFAQDEKKGKPMPKGKAVMWEPVNVEERDLFNGPGGTAMAPDLKRIELIQEEKDGHNKKFRIRDGSGKVWVAKLGREAKPETAAVR